MIRRSSRCGLLLFIFIYIYAVLAHVGRAPVSKTGSGRFESCKRCHAAGGAYPAHDRILTENSVKN